METSIGNTKFGAITDELSYLELLETILKKGQSVDDRTGVGTLSIFGTQTVYDLEAGFPLFTSKKVHWSAVVHELLWFISGSTNITYLKENKVRIWDEWADEKGNLGPVYGKQWRAWNGYEPIVQGPATKQTLMEKGFPSAEHMLEDNIEYWAQLDIKYQIDQLGQVIHQIKESPASRRMIVSAWNPADVPKMALPPCHLLFQFYCDGPDHLSLQMYQRSADMFLGVPFNVASYSLLLAMVAQIVGRKPKHFIHVTGDTHIYKNHIEQVKEQLSRIPDLREFPTLELNQEIKDINLFKFEDIVIKDYNPHPAIKGKVAV